jgi:hypothetical protein
MHQLSVLHSLKIKDQKINSVLCLVMQMLQHTGQYKTPTTCIYYHCSFRFFWAGKFSLTEKYQTAHVQNQKYQKIPKSYLFLALELHLVDIFHQTTFTINGSTLDRKQFTGISVNNEGVQLNVF